MRILVTGIAGFIGSSIARALLREGHAVRGVDNFSTGKRENLADLHAIELLEGDLNQPGVADAAVRGMEIVFHEAAIPSVPRSVKEPYLSFEANESATLRLLLAARDAGVKRVVYAASSSAYGNSETLPKVETMTPAPISPYAVAKLAGEYYMQCFSRTYGLETVSLRYFNVFGPFQDPASQYSGVLAVFINRMLSAEPIQIFGDGEQSRDFTYIDNVVSANLAVAFAPATEVSGRMFNVATGARVTLNKAFSLLAQITNYKLQPQYMPVRVGDVRHSLADISAASRAFSYKPLVNFEEGSKRTVAWYQSLKA